MSNELEDEPAKPKPDRKAIYTLLLIAFVDLLGFGLVIPLLPYYAVRFDATPLTVNLIAACFSFFQFIGAPILGMWSDRIGRRPVLMFSQWGAVVGYLILASATIFDFGSPTVGLSLIFLSRIIDGATAGNLTVANAYISDVVDRKDRAGIQGLLGAAFGLGFALGPAIGGILGHYHSAIPALVAAGMSMLSSIMVWRFLPESHTDRRKTQVSVFPLSPANIKVIRSQPMVLWISLVWFISMLAFVMLEPNIPLLLQRDFNFGQREAGLFFGFVGLVIIIVQGGLVRPLNKVFGEWTLATIGATIGVVAMSLYATLQLIMPVTFTGSVYAHPAFLLLGCAALLNALGRSLQTPTLAAMVSQNSDPKVQGAVFGVYQGMASLARVIGPIIGGLLFSKHPASMFILAASLLACAALILLYIRKRLAPPSSDLSSAVPIPVEQDDAVSTAATKPVT